MNVSGVRFGGVRFEEAVGNALIYKICVVTMHVGTEEPEPFQERKDLFTT